MGEFLISLRPAGGAVPPPSPQKAADAVVVEPSGGANGMRNDVDRRSQQRSLPERQVALRPLPGPEPPTGPPPTFEANVLEAEERQQREARRAGDPAQSPEQRGPTGGAGPGEARWLAPEAPPRVVDLLR